MAVQGIWEVKFSKNVHWELEAGAHNTVWHRKRGTTILNKLWEWHNEAQMTLMMVEMTQH